MKRITPLLFLLITISFNTLYAEKPAILPMKERAAIVNKWLEQRLETVLPEVMKREKLDMWIVICREYNEDPVYLTLVPEPVFAARRTTILVFYDQGEKGIERLAVSRYGIRNFYKGAWDPQEMGQWEALAKVVKDRDPKRIGINESETFAFGDGLSAAHKGQLVKALGSKYASRLHSADNLAVGWLETRTEAELEVYHHITSIAHEIIREAFSNDVITPGITTTEDVVWWFREKIRELKLTTWFQPSVDIQRQKGVFDDQSEKNVIHRGDILHCDVGIVYLRLNTDTQEHAYVLKENESEIPESLKKAMKVGNRLQDILTDNFDKGLSGNDILAAAIKEMQAQGINGSIYTHPLGYHGHAAGPTIGLWDNQINVPGKGDYPLFYNTCHSIELNAKTKLSEWDGQEIRIALEQDAVYTKNGVKYLDGRQTEFHIVK
jgi:Xaa-Pro aminopeptidase